MDEDVCKGVEYDLCQRAADGHHQESLRTMSEWPALYRRIHLDCTEMLDSDSKNTLVQARCSMLSKVEARALNGEKSDAIKSSQVAKFLYEDMICNRGVFGYLVSDGRCKNQGVVEGLVTFVRNQG